jgi:hypothetical protein
MYGSAALRRVAALADAPQSPLDIAAAMRIQRSVPRGYGRPILDRLVVRRAQRSEWMAVKAAHRAGEVSEYQVFKARAELTGESPAALYNLSRKRKQCAAHGTPPSIAERYFGDVRFYTARPETLPRRYATPELTETERFEREHPTHYRQLELRAAARAPLPLPCDVIAIDFEWRKAA